MGICTYCSQQQESIHANTLSLSDSSIIAKPVDYQYSSKTSFSVLSWNVEHFVDPYDDPYINHPRENNPSEDLNQRLTLLIAALRQADADIVVLQEFESEKYLMKLAEDTFPELGYRFFSDAASPNWYMNVVLMSRYPLGVLRAYGDVTTPVTGFVDSEGNKQTQNHINTRMWSLQIFPAPDYEFWLTGVHLKAGRGERNISMRTGQIQFLQTEFDQLIAADPSRNIMMAGDFNAYPNSSELKLLTTQGDGNYLIDPMDSVVLTHPSDEPQRRLDYMLVNANLQQEMIPNSVKVKYFFSPDSMRMISDHLPVMGSFYRKDR